MFLDANSFSSGQVQRTKVCVFGSGPAGIALARSLSGRGIPVLLVEAGGDEYDDASQEFYRGTVIGDKYYDLSEARLRMFGGTSNHWGGYCIPLDAHDFDPHPAFPFTGWPISKADIAPYLEGACDILDIPNQFEERLLGRDVRQTQFQFSELLGIGEKYRDYIEASTTLDVCLDSALIGIDANAGGRIISATVRSTSGADWSVEADHYVMCLGGIENPRLLLWFNEQSGRRLIANHDLIGRYWMEHPLAIVGDAIFANGGEGLFRDDGEEASFATTGAFQRRVGVLNADLLVNEVPYSKTKGLIADIMCVAPGLGRSIMTLFDKELVCGARVRSHFEQAPVYENRVALGSEKDRYGIPRPELYWKRSQADRQTVVSTARAFAEKMADLDLARIRLADWILDDAPIPDADIMAGWHHMGGTRMSLDDSKGIVDANLKVHGIDNLYIGGSSVYPTGGYANPTLTIVQLSLRLADHLENVLGNSNQ